MDTLSRFFKTGDDFPGDVAMPQGDQGGDIPWMRFNITGAHGFGAARSNEQRSHGYVLSRMAYENMIHDEQLMRQHLPIGSLCFLMLRDPDQPFSENVVVHTLSTLNQWMRKRKQTADISLNDGLSFALNWTFMGVPMEVIQRETLMEGIETRVTLCDHGPVDIKNVFAASGRPLACGTKVYLLLQKVPVDEPFEQTQRFMEAGAGQEFVQYDYLKSDLRPEARAKVPCCWQLVPYATRSEMEPPEHMWSGPDWTGTWYYLGVVQTSDTQKAAPEVFQRTAMDTAFPDPNKPWNEDFDSLFKLSIFLDLGRR